MDTTQQERRQFSRVILDWPVEVSYQGKRYPSATLVDLSFRGALLKGDSLELNEGSLVELHIHIPQSQLELYIKAHVVRATGEIHALRIDSMDLETMSELRRVIELNLGSDSLLQREMEQLLT